MTAVPAPTVEPTAYRVSLLPEGHLSYRIYLVTVEYVAKDRWGVTRAWYHLHQDGEWEFGRPCLADSPPLDTALDLAREASPHVTVNGRSAAEVLLASWAAEGPIPAGGNAEDCPRCCDPLLPYPFTCPGHETPATEET